MKKLIKYEFRKTRAPKLILLGITAAAEAAFLIGIFKNDHEWSGVSALILALLAVGGVLMMGLMSIVTLHRDINTRQGYMLFMTPNSSYRILGAKVVENGLSMLLTGAFFFGLGALDIMLLFGRFGSIADLWKIIENFIHSRNVQLQLNAGVIASLLLYLLTRWFAAVTVAFLADVICAALLNGRKYNGLLTVVFYLVLMFALQCLTGLATWAFIPEGTSVNRVILLRGAVSLVFAGLAYAAAAEIMERKLSV